MDQPIDQLAMHHVREQRLVQGDQAALTELYVVADLVKTHVLILKEVIDAQASGHLVQAYSALRRVADHMAMIANPLADAIIKQFPAKYAI
jgi:hypothetical protein